MKKTLVAAALAVVALCATPDASRRADAAPFSSAMDLVESNLLTFEQGQLTQEQIDGIAEIRALLEAKDSKSFSTDWKNLGKIDKILQRIFAGDTQKLDAVDNMIVGIEILGGLALPNQANLAALGGGLGAVVTVSKNVLKRLNARDLDKDEMVGGLGDLRINRAKYFAKGFALYKYCEVVIRRYGN